MEIWRIHDVPRDRNVINNVFLHSREEIWETVQRFINWLSTVPQIVIDCLCLQAIIYHFSTVLFKTPVSELSLS